LGLTTIWKRWKHSYMQPCFCWNPMIILYLNYFNKRKRWWNPSTHIPPSQGHGCIFIVFFFFEKTKEALNPKVKILFSERQISIYTATQKIWTEHFVTNHSFNAKCIQWKRQSYPNCMLGKFFGKDNSVIILLQFTVIYI